MGLAILLVVIFATSSVSDMAARFGAWGTLVGFIVARVGYGIWDRERIPRDGFFG